MKKKRNRQREWESEEAKRNERKMPSNDNSTYILCVRVCVFLSYSQVHYTLRTYKNCLLLYFISSCLNLFNFVVVVVFELFNSYSIRLFFFVIVHRQSAFIFFSSSFISLLWWLSTWFHYHFPLIIGYFRLHYEASRRRRCCFSALLAFAFISILIHCFYIISVCHYIDFDRRCWRSNIVKST